MSAQSLRTIVDALQLIGLRGGMSVREIGQTLGLPRSTAHRMVASLLELRFLEKNKTGGGYTIGPLLGELAHGPHTHQHLIETCRPALRALRDATGETVALHIMQAERRVLIDQVESSHELRWVYGNPLVPMPLHAGAAAKMLLALLSPSDAARIIERDELVRYTPSTPQDPDQLLSELAQIRQRGYSESLEEVTLGIASLAVPVLGSLEGSLPLAVMSLTAPAARFPAERKPTLLAALRSAAAAATQRLTTEPGTSTS